MLLSRFYPNQLDLYVKETMKKVLHEWTIFAGKSLGETIQEILSDLRNYFDKALSPKILFKNERKQYDEVSAKHIPPSVVNEADHFGYLFVKLLRISRAAKIERETLLKLYQEILDLLKSMFQQVRSRFR
ncbi:protein MRG2-like isoform X2 [Apium graveolens]|uniref:protein MRG2-like isoform X2 n=1 Tax=Apium graveolens TaxID=4045 RepID=UPI003D7B27A7